jgi:hypothetical protein
MAGGSRVIDLVALLLLLSVDVGEESLLLEDWSRLGLYSRCVLRRYSFCMIQLERYLKDTSSTCPLLAILVTKSS